MCKVPKCVVLSRFFDKNSVKSTYSVFCAYSVNFTKFFEKSWQHSFNEGKITDPTNVVARAADAKTGGNQHVALFSYEPGFLRLVMCDNRSDNNTTLHMLHI